MYFCLLWILCSRKSNKPMEWCNFPLKIVFFAFYRDRNNMQESLGHNEKQIPVSSVVRNNQAGLPFAVTSRCPSVGKDSAQKTPHCLLLFDITGGVFFINKKQTTQHPTFTTSMSYRPLQVRSSL